MLASSAAAALPTPSQEVLLLGDIAGSGSQIHFTWQAVGVYNYAGSRSSWPVFVALKRF